jgi:hypothetical protein
MTNPMAALSRDSYSQRSDTSSRRTDASLRRSDSSCTVGCRRLQYRSDMVPCDAWNRA